MILSTSKKDHIVIVGASLAGSIAALTLAQAGVDVTLIDKEQFPRRKACGEGLSMRGQTELSAANCSLDQLECPHSLLTGYRIFQGSRSFFIPDRTGLVGVSRSQLDYKLLQKAATYPNVRVALGKRAVLRDLAKNSCSLDVGGMQVNGSLLVIADGAGSPTLRTLGFNPKNSFYPAHKRYRGRNHIAPNHLPYARLGTSSSWVLHSGTLRPSVHSFLVPDGEIYLTPLPNARFNLSALGAPSLIQRLSHVNTLKLEVERISHILEISAELESSSISCGAVNSLYRCATYQGAIVVGDACETFDPCAGFGMTHALISGRLAARCIIEAIGSTDPASALLRYQELREAQVRDVRGFVRLTTAMMGSRLGRATLPMLITSGLAASVSDSIHNPGASNLARRMVSLIGARRGARVRLIPAGKGALF